MFNLAKKYHPDTKEDGMSNSDFVEINKAYEDIIENYEIYQKYIREIIHKNVDKSEKAKKMRMDFTLSKSH